MKKIYTLIFAFLMIASSTLFAEWEECNDGLEYHGNITQILKSNGKIYANGMAGVFMSSNEGKSWGNISEDYNVIDYIFIEDSIIYANSTNYFSILSKDYGKTWEMLNKPSGFQYGITSTCKINDKILFNAHDQTIYPFDLNTLKFDEGKVYISECKIFVGLDNKVFGAKRNKFYISNDECKSWTYISQVDNNSDIKKIIKNKSFLVSYFENGKIYISKDSAKTWLCVNNQLENKNVQSFDMSNDTLIFTSYDNIYLSFDFGQNWKTLNKNDYDFSNPNGNIVLFENSKIYIANLQIGISISEDFGDTWKISNSGFPLGETYNSFFTSDNNLIIRNSYTNLFELKNKYWKNISEDQIPINEMLDFERTDSNYYVYSQISFYSKNEDSTNWTKHNYENISNITTLKFVKDLIYAISDNTLYLSTSLGKSWLKLSKINSKNSIKQIQMNQNFIYISNEIEGFISTDNGISWKEISKIPNPYNLKLLNDQVFYMDLNKFVFSNDYGFTWNSIKIGGDTSYLSAFTFNDDKIYVNKYKEGLFVSDLKNFKFQLIDTSVVPKKYSVNMQIQNEYLYLLIFNDGVFRAKLSELGSTNSMEEFEYIQNENANFTIYPNPSSDYLNIHFTNNVNPNSKIELFDILGNQVYQSQITSSDQDTKFNLESLQAGVYLLKIADKVERIVVNK